MMDFVRKKIRGQSQKIQKTWVSDEQYRVTWKKEDYGITLPPPLFQAVVRILLPDGREMWDKVHRRVAFRTYKAAIKACEQHKKQWDKALEASGIRRLQDIFGIVPFGYPLWVKPKLSRKLYGILQISGDAR